jgi:hypothetical protein
MNATVLLFFWASSSGCSARSSLYWSLGIHAWGNQFGKLRWCTERNIPVVEFWLSLVQAIIKLGRLIRQAWTCYRWQGRPRRRP